jgi:hypothetical protein
VYLSRREISKYRNTYRRNLQGPGR